MVNRLTFVSDLAYPVDTHWPPGHPREGESTLHMLLSGDWTVGGQPVNRDGEVNFNQDFAGGAATLGVTNDPGTGAPIPTANSWTFTADFAIPRWPTGSSFIFFLTVAGLPNPPYAPGGTAGLSIGLTRTGFFFLEGQLEDHVEETGVTYHGGAVSVHLEVEPRGPWYVQVFAGGALAITGCGPRWGGGGLYAATFGVMSVTGANPVAVLTTRAVSGAEGVRVGPAECPHGLPAGGARTQAFWVP